ncbi:hypothetical protein PR048_031683 [Dryococelus australis]|uniref:Uncharacterized protein n=1 Tax=Dryococelus australis TaxID=614101 RepID=A0ABQ9G5Z0_9NEOP|nr:hypothetical protein PR048_031683 [Dryococelus australis]
MHFVGLEERAYRILGQCPMPFGMTVYLCYARNLVTPPSCAYQAKTTYQKIQTPKNPRERKSHRQSPQKDIIRQKYSGRAPAKLARGPALNFATNFLPIRSRDQPLKSHGKFSLRVGVTEHLMRVPESPLSLPSCRRNPPGSSYRVVTSAFARLSLRGDLGYPLVDDRPIMNAVKYKVVSGVVWTNRTTLVFDGRSLVLASESRSQKTCHGDYLAGRQHSHAHNRFLGAPDTSTILASHLGEPGSTPRRVAPGYSHVGIVPDDPADRRVFPKKDLPFPPTMHSGAAPYSHRFTFIGS